MEMFHDVSEILEDKFIYNRTAFLNLWYAMMGQVIRKQT
jgi:hypothetical protein